MVSILKTDKIQASHGSTINVTSGHKLSGAAGSIVVPGTILQIVELGSAADFSSSTKDSFVDTNYSLSITPQFSNSKILIQSTLVARVDGSGAIIRAGYRFVRRISGSDTVVSNSEGTKEHLQSRGSPGELNVTIGYMYYDSPGTTNAVTYVLQGNMRSDTSASVFRQRALTYGGSFILTEIAQ